ncbi:hypothetical protein AN618_23450 [Fervidicola ferrireducens]|uniref:ACT domain-containing protein n=1 Tax=Fervidicola ferrireducens TaxID=520764 RepID=A0A140L197_9FIRM|nr:hypothetical protein [Fervidicola ferrireducens]KXG74322.1 hypothetical protein AN618_23450 [Fervidicola ferrireducens]
MLVKQLSVFLENTPGRLYSVTSVLPENNVKIKALMLADTADFGVLRLIVDEPEKTLRILQENGYAAKITNAIAIEVCDSPFQQMQKILKLLSEKNINVEYMYAFSGETPGTALVVFRVDDLETAMEYLKRKKMTV